MKTRKNILMVLGLVLLLGVSYAFYTYQKYSGMQNLLNGGVSVVWVTSSLGLRPVINIRSDVLISSGDGTIENPYTLKLQ